jgi:hypothetical protein
MSVYDDITSRERVTSKLWRGRIASSPTNVHQFVDVKIPAFSGELRWKKCRWEPRYKIEEVEVAESGEGSHTVPIPQLLLPKRDDLCLCIFDNYKELWVVMWWPL